MIGYLIVGVALAGTAYAAYRDFMTTEVSDAVSYATAGAALLLHALNSYLHGDVTFFLLSLATGTLFFLVGAFFYLTGVWGGADAFVMGATGFALPYLPDGFAPIAQAPWPFQLTLMLDLFIIGTLYILGYAVFQGLRSKKVMERFWNDIGQYWRRLAAITVLYAVAVVGVTFAVTGGMAVERLATMTRYVPLLIGLLVLYRYLKIVEEAAMTEEMPVDELEPGDVIVESVEVEGEVMRHQSLLGKVLERLRAVNPFGPLDRSLERLEQWIGYPEIVGLTEEEIAAIRERRETVTRKTGVRFVPAFPAAVLVSVTVGDLVYLVVSGIV